MNEVFQPLGTSLPGSATGLLVVWSISNNLP